MKQILLLLAAVFTLNLSAQAPIWKKEQLMPTKELADKINAKTKDCPLIFNVGPMDAIKGAVFVGRGTSVSGIEKLKQSVMWEPKTRPIVIYCGCCSYASCPNIKPAYDALVAAGYKNTRVLELPEGLAPDWVAKGYPME